VADSFEAVNALYLNTMQMVATDPEVMTIQPNDVVVVYSSRELGQKGVFKVQNLVPGDSGFASFSCKYQKRE
jgi:hypothetical protein